MHIVHIETGGGSGGQPRRTVNESLGMMARGHRITIVCPEHIYLNTAAREAGLTVVNMPLRRKNWSNFRLLKRWLLSQRDTIDVINCHNSIDTWLCALIGLTYKIPPIIRTRHSSGTIRNNLANRWLFSRACQHIVTTGELLRHQYAEVGVPLSQSTSVPSGVDISSYIPRDKMQARQALNLPENKFLVGVVAGLRYAKGHHLLLEIVCKLPEDILFVFVGSGQEFAALQQCCVLQGIEDRIMMVGQQSNPELWFPAFDLTVSPSFYDEGVPQSVMQSQACQIATIATDAGSTRDVIMDNDSGLLIPMHNTQAIQHAIEKLYHNSELRDRLAAQGLRTVQKGFTHNDMLNAMEKIFTRAIAESGRSVSHSLPTAFSDAADI